MALNLIWLFLILGGFLIACIRVVFFHELSAFDSLVKSVFEMAETSVKISIGLVGTMTFWMGLMRVGEKGGLISFLSRISSPFFTKLFPDIPKNHPALGSMMMNFSANMLGLDNAATPLGLKAMKELQELNPVKDTASDAQILFLVLNSAGLTIIPVGVMAVRASMGAQNPTDIFLPTLLATAFGLLIALVATSFFQKINLLAKEVMITLGALAIALVTVFYFTLDLSSERLEQVTSLFGNFMILLFIVVFLGVAALRRQYVYADFIEGSKEGFQTSISIIPYLVAMLVAIGIFRASGGLELALVAVEKLLALVHIHTDVLPAMPTAFMKTLSGSGARAMMVEVMKTHGVDSFLGRLSGVFQGSSETTLYVLAVYYGSVQVRYTRHTLTCGLIADAAAIVASIFVAKIFFVGF